MITFRTQFAFKFGPISGRHYLPSIINNKSIAYSWMGESWDAWILKFFFFWIPVIQKKSNVGIAVSKGESSVGDTCSAMIPLSASKTLLFIFLSAYAACPPVVQEVCSWAWEDGALAFSITSAQYTFISILVGIYSPCVLLPPWPFWDFTQPLLRLKGLWSLPENLNLAGAPSSRVLLTAGSAFWQYIFKEISGKGSGFENVWFGMIDCLASLHHWN